MTITRKRLPFVRVISLLAVSFISTSRIGLHQTTCLNRHWIRERKREMFYLTTHSTHFIYGYMSSDIGLRTILIVRKETRCRHIGYSYRLTARVLLYAYPTDMITHTTAFVTPVVEHWLEREIAQWVHPSELRPAATGYRHVKIS